MAEQRFNFQNQWILSEQNTSLALTNLKLAQNRYKTAQMQYDEARIAFENGLEVLPEVAQRQEAMVRAQIDYINTELDYRLTKLQWMYYSGILAKRFLGMPDQELDKVVGGNKLLGVGTSGPLSPADPDSEEVFPMDTNTPGADSRRPIGRVRPKVNDLPGIGEDVKARPAAAAPGKSADTDTGTGSPASADGQKPAAGPATDAKARPAASEPASAASNDLTAVPTLADN